MSAFGFGRSGRYAAGVALGYGLLSATYILLSSALAADASHTVEELKRIESIKGVAFVVVTSLLVYLGAFVAMRRIERDTRELMRRDQALITAGGRVFAGLIASSVGHDANNVLVAVLSDLEDIAAHAQPAEAERVRRLRHSVERLVELNRRLVGAARQGLPREFEPIDVVSIARQSVDSLRSHAHVRKCRLAFVGEGQVRVAGTPLLLHQIVTNLVLNAAEATSSSGSVEVRVFAHAGEAVLEVHDDGPGVPRELRGTLFDALVTTKPDGNGLGLFSVRACAKGLGGRVEIDDSPLGGALFRVRLPFDAPRAPLPDRSGMAASPRT